MTLLHWTLLSATITLCSVGAAAAIRPADKPSMGVVVDAGDYVVKGKTVKVSKTTKLPVYGPNKVFATSEEQILSEGRPGSYTGGTSLKNTLGPIDKSTRLLFSIDPLSVKVHSSKAGGMVYEEGRDYFLDHDWGGMSRIDGGQIEKGQTVYIDYAARRERVDSVQVSENGVVSIKQGVPAAVCAAAPEPDHDCTVLANIYIPYLCSSITQDCICPMPAENGDWHRFIKVSGREHLTHTLSVLREHKPLTVVCWGDSVTEGCSAVPREKCYVELLRTQLRESFPKSKTTVINAGIGGSNTDSRRDGFEKEVLAYCPDLITVEFVNDIGKSPEVIKANWAEFISRARQKNPNVEFILFTPHQMMPVWMGAFNKCADAMRQAAQDNGAALADVANVWANLRLIGIPYETLLANGLNHPNNLGHEFFTASIMELLQGHR